MVENTAEKKSTREQVKGLEAVELVGILGFSLYFAWMFVCFYWFFAEALNDVDLGQRDLTQSFIFVGTVIGYILMHCLGKLASFSPFKLPFVAGCGVGVLLLPVIVTLIFFITPVPPAACWVVNLLTGIVGAVLCILWLDICSRSTENGEYRFVSFSLFAGGALFALIMLMPEIAQVILAVVYGLGSVALVYYCSHRAPLNEEAPLVETECGKWEFASEIEPALAAFGVVFGLCFVYLFNYGSATLIIGLLFVLPGSAVIAILSSVGREVGITVIQRVILCVTVFSCVATPFVSQQIQVFTVGIAIAAWAALLSVNYALVVRKTKKNWVAPAFRMVPCRLIFVAVGFALGWVLAAVLSFVYGAHADVFATVRLVMAVVLVVVFMIFMPDAHHHDHDAMEQLAQGTTPRVVTAGYSENQVFEAKCLAAAELFKLSPRETDILSYLARGRNAAYLQEKLCISPHTVKSHIYSIYRKFDIHSQQKLMDFIEEYPLSEEELARYCKGGEE